MSDVRRRGVVVGQRAGQFSVCVGLGEQLVRLIAFNAEAGSPDDDA
jgi:hypothetical protein